MNDKFGTFNFKMIILSTRGNMVPTSTANNYAARLSKRKTKIIPPCLWKKKLTVTRPFTKFIGPKS